MIRHYDYHMYELELSEFTVRKLDQIMHIEKLKTHDEAIRHLIRFFNAER